MKNKTIVYILAFVVVALFSTGKLSAKKQEIPAELILNGMSNEQSSGDVTTFLNVFSYKVVIPSTDIIGKFKENNWSLVFRDIHSNPHVDLSKVQIRLSQVNGDANLSELGGNHTPVSLYNNEVDIIHKSKFFLENGKDRKEYLFHFDIIINKKDFQINEFELSFDIALLRPNRTEITYPQSILQVLIPVNPMPEPDFEFEVYADASLNFNLPEDYTRKVESSEVSWVKVTSKDKGYTVNVQTSDSYFEGESDIPVGVVSMQVEDKIGSRTGPEIALKNSGQTVFNGNATGSEPRKLDVRYFISPDNAKGLAIYKPGNYVTRLTYTLLPQ